MDSEPPKETQNEECSRKDAIKHKNKSNWKKAEIVAVFAVIEIISLVLWQKAEDFSGDPAKFIHWISECGFLAGAGYLAHKLTKKHFLIWICYVALCALLALTKSIEPKPHFKLSLQMGDSPDSKVYLTNDFLFDRRLAKIGDLPKGRILIHTFVNGCLLIPVKEGESNMVFNFTAENDSSVKVNDLTLVVGFPAPWSVGFDPIKWHKADETLIVPDWKFDATNIQYVAAQSPYVLFPYDSLNFPSITNPCTPEYIGSTFKGGLVELAVRSTGFENFLAANIIFIPAGTNSFKPFVTLGHFETNGTIHITPTQKEFEDSQQ